MTNEVLRMIQKRRSVRAFLPKQIREEEVAAIVEAGRYAPHGGDESWHFTVIQNPAILEELNRMAKYYAAKSGIPWLEDMGRNADFHSVYRAPTVILVSAEEEGVCPESDVAAATQNMLLAAESLGVASCWGYFITQAFLLDEGVVMGRKLKIPEGYKVYSSVMLGYRGGDVPPTPARRADTVTYIK